MKKPVECFYIGDENRSQKKPIITVIGFDVTVVSWERTAI